MKQAAALIFTLALAACGGGAMPGHSGSVQPLGAGREGTGLLALAPTAAATPHASFVTLVIMENRDYKLVVGNKSAPYFNKTLLPQGVLMTNSHAVGHPSQPNYLELFSGTNQGVTDDSCPHTFSNRNIASELIADGKTFTGYAESMPRTGYTGCSAGSLYMRKHAPWVNFTSVPATDNVPYKGFPVSPASFVWITPNMCHDMHDCSTGTGDTWLKSNLPKIIAWNAAHSGLLILTWDEADPDTSGTNQIATVLVGPTIVPNTTSSQDITHFTVLHTLETIYGLPCIKNDCAAGEITGIWR
ncbi:MAG: alkaline phosphatase family protein [Candidatus Eremiobacteraeota bacterium]|nr:alkaline phosphatase family protein [Candidatus Eremiobacteraeota bacterium]